MTITRREKWLAKLCWPEVDTQRTSFYTADFGETIYMLKPAPESSAAVWNCETMFPDTPDIIEVELEKWKCIGRRRYCVAYWWYSPELDVVLIKEVEHGRVR